MLPLLVRLEAAHITMDGKADEPAWAQAAVLPDPTVYEPSADVAPLGSVRTLLLCDDEGIYLHFTVTDPEPEAVRAGLGRRDSRDPDDAVGVYLDPGAGGRRAYLFESNPIGVQSDALHLPAQREDDTSWDAVWRSSGHRTATGYEVEIAIPWASVKMSGSVERLGILVTRTLARKGQRYAWPLVEPHTDPLLAEATLEGPGRLPRRVGLELMPELTGSYGVPAVESGRLGFYGLSPGLTVRYAPDHGITAVGTFNPDFSQLESDASQIDVNQRYALSYEEKRPFFLEGQDWFDHPIDGMVYTRSMNTPIYGARVTGEAGPVGLAALNVLDLTPPPSVSEGGGWTTDQLAGHASMDTLLRARVNVHGESYLGVLGSDRTVLDTGLWNRVIGVDGAVRVNKQARVEVAAMGSATTLTEGAAPTYGEAWTANGLWSGKHLYWLARFNGTSAGFRQENGFVPEADNLGAATEAHYNLETGSDAVPVVSVEPLDVWSYWTFAGDPRSRGIDPSAWVQFGNGAFLKVDERIAGEAFAGEWINFANTDVYAETALGRTLRTELGGTFGTAPYYDADDPRPGRLLEGFAWAEWQPVPELTLSVGPEVARMTELDGAPLFVAWTARARAELFVQRTVWIRTVYDRAGGESDSWRLEPVAAWEWTPGRAIYLGGAVGQDGDPYWQAFGKVSWVFGV